MSSKLRQASTSSTHHKLKDKRRRISNVSHWSIHNGLDMFDGKLRLPLGPHDSRTAQARVHALGYQATYHKQDGHMYNNI